MLNAQKAKLIIAACLSFFVGTFLALYTKNLPTFGAGVLVAAYFLVEFLTMLKNSKADKYIKVTALAVNADESRAGLEPRETWRFIPVNEDGEYLDKNGVDIRWNTTATQLDSLKKERSGALYDLMDALDSSAYDETAQGEENYILAQNKLWVITGEVSDFSAQIAALTQQSAQVQAQLGAPTQITAPQTGYFIRSTAAGRLNAGADDILALDAAGLEAYLNSDPELPLDGCAGKLVSGFTWRYVGLCSAKEGEKLLGDNGKPLTRSVKIKFPGQMETPLKASVSEVSIDEASGLARFVVTCEVINGDVLRLSRAKAQIIVDETTGLRIPIEAVHYLKEDGTESETQGENYIPGVYVKYGNLARFCKIDPVDSAHPLVTDGDYCIVMPSSTDKTKTISEVRLYDEIIVSGQNLYDGKLL